MRRFAGISTLIVAGFAGSAAGEFITPDTFGWSRGDAGTAYFEWDQFFSTSGGNSPDVGVFDSAIPEGNIAPDVRELSGGAIITSTRGIYSLGTDLDIEAVVPGLFAGGGLETATLTEVIVQIRTLGREIDPETMRLNGVAPRSSTELDRIVLGDPDAIFGGAQVDNLYRFELFGSPSEITLGFQSLDLSMGLDRLSFDYRVIDPVFGPTGETLNGSVGPVPAPGVAGLGMVCLLSLSTRRRG